MELRENERDRKKIDERRERERRKKERESEKRMLAKWREEEIKEKTLRPAGYKKGEGDFFGLGHRR